MEKELKKFVIRIAKKENPTPAELKSMVEIVKIIYPYKDYIVSEILP